MLIIVDVGLLLHYYTAAIVLNRCNVVFQPHVMWKTSYKNLQRFVQPIIKLQ